MKKQFFVCAMLTCIVVSFSACMNFSCEKDKDVLGYLIRNSDDVSPKYLKAKFVEDIDNVVIPLDCAEMIDDEDLYYACLNFFSKEMDLYRGDYKGNYEDLHGKIFLEDNWVDYVVQGKEYQKGYYRRDEQYAGTLAYLHQNIEKAQILIAELEKKYYPFIDNLAAESLEIINSQRLATSSKYNIQLVEYMLKGEEPYFFLVTITQFDNGIRQINIQYEGSRMNRLQNEKLELLEKYSIMNK